MKCALICIKCDVQITSSELILIAQGQILSGIALEVHTEMQVSKSSVQFRFYTSYGAGFIHTIQNTIKSFNIINTTISGASQIQSKFNGYVTSGLYSDNDIFVNNVYVCSKMKMVGESTFNLVESNQIIPKCSICGGLFVVYGLCQAQLVNSINVDNELQCVFQRSSTERLGVEMNFNNLNVIYVIQEDF
ncbi:Hypothetical_protein [Hexamita inflata]|uniref:Hypothetical_protein n=1 Tax=Hexamita inflata TaxID=28002 RepID=A0ABP1HRC7_9EUKA